MEKDFWARTGVQKVHTEYPVEYEIVMAYGGVYGGGIVWVVFGWGRGSYCEVCVFVCICVYVCVRWMVG